MEPAIIGILISTIALVLSIWTRFEAVILAKRQRKIIRARNAGQALIAAQELKNRLYDCIESFETEDKAIIEANTPHLIAKKIAFQEAIKKIKGEYDQVWDFLKALELIVMAFESGQEPSIDESQLEAKIAHFHQRRILAEFDVRYVQCATDSSDMSTKQS